MLIQSDYHIHASFYRIKGPSAEPGPTAKEQLAAARNAGSRFVGLLEHCNASPKHPFSCLEELSAEYHASDFDRHEVFLGVEADLAEDGSDACGQTGREKLGLHYVIGSVHISPAEVTDCRKYIEIEHQRIVRALKYNDNVDIIGHPFGEGFRFANTGRIQKWNWSLIPPDYLEEILLLAKESEKALEINRCDFDDPCYREFLQKIRAQDILFSIGSDAHDTKDVALARSRTETLNQLGFQEQFHWKIDR